MTSLMPRVLSNGSIFMDPFAAMREFEKMISLGTHTAYPPYNLVKKSDSKFQLEFALAGFQKKDIEIILEGNMLIIKGTATDEAIESDVYLHRGIGMRKFTRQFQLPEHVVVDAAEMENGILVIALSRLVPEEKKPKQITIK